MFRRCWREAHSDQVVRDASVCTPAMKLEAIRSQTPSSEAPLVHSIRPKCACEGAHPLAQREQTSATSREGAVSLLCQTASIASSARAVRQRDFHRAHKPRCPTSCNAGRLRRRPASISAEGSSRGSNGCTRFHIAASPAALLRYFLRRSNHFLRRSNRFFCFGDGG